jgi:NADH-quinone oxidoreductase subunit C
MADAMNEFLQPIVTQAQSRFEAGTYVHAGEVSLVIGPQHIVPLAQMLRDEYQFELLVELSAVDYFPQQTPRFHVVYRMRSIKHNQLIGIRVLLDGNAPELNSLVGVYPNANWYERELWDMFGIRVQNHPDLRRIMMPEDWVGHPLRKDYPLGYEEVAFTFNIEEVDSRKPFAKE